MKNLLKLGFFVFLWGCQTTNVLPSTSSTQSKAAESDLSEITLPNANSQQSPEVTESNALTPISTAKPAESSLNPDTELPSLASENSLSLEQTSLGPLQEFEVRFQVNDAAEASAWAGIVAAEIPHGEATLNDIFDLAYAPLGGHASGVLVFTSPEAAGKYEVRLFSAEAGQELSAIPFQVNAPIKPLSGNEIRLNKAVYAPGEQIRLELSIKAADKVDETAWLGIVPATVPHGSEAENDAQVLAYQYLGPFLAGKMTFQAPAQPGLYDFRLHDTDNNGREIVFVSFLVH